MSSDAPVPLSKNSVALPRTAVPLGIGDPVEQARAFNRRNPALTAVAVVVGAAAIGAAVWGFVRLYTR